MIGLRLICMKIWIGACLLLLVCICVTTAVVTPNTPVVGGTIPQVTVGGIGNAPLVKTPMVQSPIVQIPSSVTLPSASPTPCDTCGVVENAVVSDAVASAEVLAVQDQITAEGKSWNAGKTSMSTLSPQARQKMLGVKMPDVSIESYSTITVPALSNLPASFDWRNNGGDYTTRVKNQGQCGSCWAFAATAVAETYMELFNKVPGLNPDYSEQYLIGTSAGSCNGGWPRDAMQYYTDVAGRDGKVGEVNETDWPYTATNGVSKDLTGIHRIILPNAKVVQTYGNTAQIKSAMYQYGSVELIFKVYSSFYSYKSGIYEKLARDTYQGLHAVQRIGWGKDANGRDYWICKNSWGTSWGDSGYFKIYADQLGSKDSNGVIWDTVAFIKPLTSPTPTPVPTTPVPTPTPTPTPTPVVASFTANKTTGPAPLVVSFTDTSKGYPNQWQWFINGVVQATTKAFTWTFSNAGSYNVKLRVANNNSNATTPNTTITVTSQPTVKADFTVKSTKISSIKYQMVLTDKSTGANTVTFSLYKNNAAATGTPYAKGSSKIGGSIKANLPRGTWTVKEVATNTIYKISNTLIKPNVLSF